MGHPRHTANLTGWIPSVIDIIHGQPRFDTLTVTVKDLLRDLSAGNLSSVDIVKEYYRSILSYNGYLNSVYELAPGALEQAEKLDQMRGQGQILGHLHGIPVLLKVNTSPSFTAWCVLRIIYRTISRLRLTSGWAHKQVV
jgi:hypothetical protein